MTRHDRPVVVNVFDDRSFYELMQTYRHARSNDDTVAAFEAVKAFVRKQR